MVSMMVRALNEKTEYSVYVMNKITIRFVELMFFDFGARKKWKKKPVAPESKNKCYKARTPRGRDDFIIVMFLKDPLAKIIM